MLVKLGLAAVLIGAALAAGEVMADPAPAPTTAAASTDPFAWLEDIHGDKALAWVKEHNAKTTAELQSDPRYAKDLADETALLSAQDRIPYVSYRGGWLYNFWQDDVHTLGLWRRTKVESYKTDKPDWDILLDLDKLSTDEGVKWSFKGADCLKPEYTRCLVSLSPGGGDAVEVREFDVNTKSFVKDGYHVDKNKTDISWIDGNHVLIGTNFGEGATTTSGYPRIVKLWTRGTPLTEAKTIYEGKAEDTSVAGIVFDTPEGPIPMVGRAIDFFDSELYAIQPDGTTKQLPIPVYSESKGILKRQFVFSLRQDWAAPDGQTYKQGALLAFNYDDWVKTGQLPKLSVLFTPTERTAIDGVGMTKDTMFVSVLDNVRGRVYAYGFDGGAWSEPKKVDLPENGSVTIADADDDSSTVMFNYQDFLTPSTLSWSFDDAAHIEPVKSLPARFDAAAYKITQYEATSKDGTKVPYFVVAPKDQAGPLPTLLYGYGGFEVSITPWYWDTAGKLWLTHGNVYVIANIRGGGEFGPRWHEAGLKANRQHVYDDFEAVGDDLVAKKITAPKQLGIMGGSNGGLLVGVAFTQRPDLFHAVVCEVPLLDMIRYTKLPPGASWIAEYGDPDKPDERAVIEKYSPYQNVKDGVQYPRVFFQTSTADDRVNPSHARKMAALMESKGYPILFHEETEGGHGRATNQKTRAMQLAMQFIYLKRELGAN